MSVTHSKALSAARSKRTKSELPIKNCWEMEPTSAPKQFKPVSLYWINLFSMQKSPANTCHKPTQPPLRQQLPGGLWCTWRPILLLRGCFYFKYILI